MAQREVGFLKIIVTADVHEKVRAFREKWASQGVKEVSDVIISVEIGNGKAAEARMTISEFLEAVGLEDADEAIRPCETCGGEGKVAALEQVYPGEPHVAEIGETDCPDCHADDQEREEEERDGF